MSSRRKVLTDSNVASIKVGVGISTPNINKIVPMEREEKPRKEILFMRISFAAFGLIMLMIFGIVI